MRLSSILGLNARTQLFAYRYNSLAAKKNADSKVRTGTLLTKSGIPTPKIYTLRIEFSTSADWSSLSISDTSSISDVRIVDKQGELTDAVANNTYIGINQTLENAQKLNKFRVTIDL